MSKELPQTESNPIAIPALNAELGKNKQGEEQVTLFGASKQEEEQSSKDGAKKGEKEKSPFDKYFDGIRDKIANNNSDPEKKQIRRVGIGIKSSDLKKAGKGAKDEGPIMVDAIKITEYTDGSSDQEDVKVPMSPEDIQGINDEIEKEKSKGLSGAMRDMAKNFAKDLQGKILGGGNVEEGEEQGNGLPNQREQEESKAKGNSQSGQSEGEEQQPTTVFRKPVGNSR